MAKRRCISIDVYENERFLELSFMAQALYTQLMLRADDEGVVINARAVMRFCDAEEDNLSELVEAEFLIPVGDVFVVKHWNVHNRIQPTKKTASLYQKELSLFEINDRKEYELINSTE